MTSSNTCDVMTGLDVTNKKASMAGELLAEYIQNLLSEWKFVPNGLKEVGYSQSDIDQLVKGTLPQKKVLDIAPRQATPDDLGKLFEKSMTLF